MNERRIRQRRNENIKLLIRRSAAILEIAILVVIFYLIWEKIYSPDFGWPFYYRGKYVLMLVYGLLVLISVNMNEGFRFGHLKVIECTISQWCSLVIVNFITYFQLCLVCNQMIRVWPMLLLTLIEIPVTLAWTALSSFIYQQVRTPFDVMMIYGNDRAAGLKIKMDTRRNKYNVKKLVPESTPVEELVQLFDEFDAVIISDISAEKRNDILKYCYMNEIRVYLTPKISDIIENGARDVNLFDTPLRLIRGQGLSLGNRILKRTMDILLSAIALVVLSPLLLLVALLIKLEDHGPVFYKQTRVTRDGRLFDIVKFRSMIVDAEKDGKAQPAIDNDPRITKVGRVIRACRIDELPQLFNILKGDMSIVGPRPERKELVEQYRMTVPEFVVREKVKGGLTGYAQVYGKYNTTPLDKVKLDLMYIENYSILLDLKIILQTVRILFQKESTEGFDKQLSEEEIKQEIRQEIEKEEE